MNGGGSCGGVAASGAQLAYWDLMGEVLLRTYMFDGGWLLLLRAWYTIPMYAARAQFFRFFYYYFLFFRLGGCSENYL